MQKMFPIKGLGGLTLVSILLCMSFQYFVNTLQNQGLYNFGVAVNKGTSRGTVVTVCDQPGASFECIVSLLYDDRLMNSVLVVNSYNGSTLSIPFPSNATSVFDIVNNSVFASVLSMNGRYYYMHFGGYFMQFDCVFFNFSLVKKTLTGSAMSMTEDDNGVIWSATYPYSGLVSYNPTTRKFSDYGSIYNQTWLMYPRSVAADNLGFVYIGIGFTFSQFICFNPNTSKAFTMLQESERIAGAAFLYRDKDGAVYGYNVNTTPWLKFYGGNMTNIGSTHTRNGKIIIAGNQDLFYIYFPSLRRLLTFDYSTRTFTIQEKNASIQTTNSFNYTCRGANIMTIQTTPDATNLIGGASFPMYFFSLNGKSNEFTNYYVVDQPNVIQTAYYETYVWMGTYPHGRLLVYDLNKPWSDPIPGTNTSNPIILTSAEPHFIRPSCVLIHPYKKIILMGGTPEYGLTGGGLLIWNRITNTSIVLDHTQVVTYHSTNSLAYVPGNPDLVMGGTTINAGTGGIPKATNAAIYLFNITSMQVVWKSNPFPGVTSYYELYANPQTGLIYGYTNNNVFFVFNPKNTTIVYSTYAHAVVEQGPHSFVPHPNGIDVYITLSTGMFKIDPNNFKLTQVFASPFILTFGGVILKNGWYYFWADANIYGFKLFNTSVVHPTLSIIPVDNSSLSIPSLSVPMFRNTSHINLSVSTSLLRVHWLQNVIKLTIMIIIGFLFISTIMIE